MTLFEKYAEHYDLYYRDKDYSGEAHNIAKLLSDQNDSVRNILELGCGTGRHAVELAKLGYQVHGVDMSPTMIGRAVEIIPDRFRKQLSFEQGDIRSLDVDVCFDAVIALFHVMSYQITNEDIQRTILNAAAHLVDGGLLVFDFWYGPAVLTLLPQDRKYSYELDNLKITRTAKPLLNTRDNLVEVAYTIDVTDSLTGDHEYIIEKHQIRYFSLPEICLFLKMGNFTLLSDSESFTNRTLSSSTWSATICAKKAVSSKQ
tara:strand:- start:2261 stop:3037 length:777 start_codon:yes stop_codon:yes gene_type:complete